MSIGKDCDGTGKARQLSALAVLARDQCSIPNTRVGQLKGPEAGGSLGI